MAAISRNVCTHSVTLLACYRFCGSCNSLQLFCKYSKMFNSANIIAQNIRTPPTMIIPLLSEINRVHKIFLSQCGRAPDRQFCIE